MLTTGDLSRIALMPNTNQSVLLKSYKDAAARDRLYAFLMRQTGVGREKVEAALDHLPVVVFADLPEAQGERMRFALELSGAAAVVVSAEEAGRYPNLPDIDPAALAKERPAKPEAPPEERKGAVTGVATAAEAPPKPERGERVTGRRTGLTPEDEWALRFQPGEVVDGRFRIEDVLGVGGMGAVYKAYDQQLKHWVALKAMLPELVADERAERRFYEEARIARTLDHPNIVRAYDVGSADDIKYLTMQYIDGPSLRQWLEQRKQQGEVVSMDEVLHIEEQVCAGLAYAHQTTIHRDIKPDNVLLEGMVADDDGRWVPPDGDWSRVQAKITDFGLAKLLSASHFSRSMHALGTAHYVAPEQIHSPGDVDQRVDVYALGVMTYELLTGTHVVGMKRPSARRDDVPEAVDDVIEKALEPNQTDRYETATAFWEGLSAAAAAETGAEREADEVEAKAKNLERIVEAGILKEFVTEHKGRWTHSEWLSLLSRLEAEGYWPIDEGAFGDRLEAVRVEWEKAEQGRVLKEQEAARRKREAEERKRQAEAERLRREREELEAERRRMRASAPAQKATAPATSGSKGCVWFLILVCLGGGGFWYMSRIWKERSRDSRPSRYVPAEMKKGVPLPELPPGFGRAFMLPTSSRDQHGNPVVSRNGSKFDPKTGWAYEVWLKQPQVEFVLIPAGEFMMGSSISPEEVVRRYKEYSSTLKTDYFKGEHPQHRVRITKPFYLGKYEVTNAQYRACKRDHDSKEYEGKSLNGEKQPVVYVSWDDAAAYCKWLSQRSGVKVGLPTEAQWEYTCRAGTTTVHYWGDKIDPAYCNFADKNTSFDWRDKELDDGQAVSASVGRYRPNAFGLHDMLGNVYEWCADWHGEDYYAKSPSADPQGPSTGTARVLRGGSWYFYPFSLRSADRFWVVPDVRCSYFGFRCVVCVALLR